MAAFHGLESAICADVGRYGPLGHVLDASIAIASVVAWDPYWPVQCAICQAL
jgi:hypothetical protein